MRRSLIDPVRAMMHLYCLQRHLKLQANLSCFCLLWQLNMSASELPGWQVDTLRKPLAPCT